MLNYGAMVKNVFAGFINGFLGVAAGNAVLDAGVNVGKMALIAGGIAALRVIQEALSPTSYQRAPGDGLATALAGGKKA